MGEATTGTEVRRANLARVLSLLHRQGPLSRAQLTRLTGFNRSTVGALAADLVQRGLARETAPDGGRVGRPSPIVHPNDKVAALAVHPDVDAVTVGVVGLGGGVRHRVRRETDGAPSPEAAAALAADVVAGLRRELAGLDAVVGVGAAVPGLVRAEDGHVLLAPHLGWEDEPFAARLAEALQLPVRAANDANLGSLAESRYGAAVGAADVVYLNGSASGIGGGAVVGGVPLHGGAGYAGEFGHTRVSVPGLPCHCGRSGCLETEVSLAGLLAALGLARADLDELQRAIAAGPSPALQAEATRQLDLLGSALTDLVNIFNPQLVVLGGFLAALYGLEPQRLRDAVAGGPIGGLGRQVDIRPAQLGAELLLVGAAELAFEPVLADAALPPAAAQPGAGADTAGAGRSGSAADAVPARGA